MRQCLERQVTFQNSPADCPGYAPGIALPHNVCERCGGDRQRDHAFGKRAATVHYVPQSREVPPALTKDQRAQGMRRLGPFPTEVDYPCGCRATGGTGMEPLPGWCPTHQQPIADTLGAQSEYGHFTYGDAVRNGPLGAPIAQDQSGGLDSSETGRGTDDAAHTVAPPAVKPKRGKANA